MNEKTLAIRKKVIKALIYIVCAFMLLIVIGIAWYKVELTRPVWRSDDISLFAKLRITWDWDIFQDSIRQVYLIKPDNKHTFIIVTNHGWDEVVERHTIYSDDGSWIIYQDYESWGKTVSIEPISMKPPQESYLVDGKDNNSIRIWRESPKHDFQLWY